MIRRLRKLSRRFRQSEDGSATAELLFWFPMFIIITYSGVDMGMLAFHQANLERSLDEIIRDVRLNNIEKYDSSDGARWEHDMLKDEICKKARFIPHCSDNLALEMKPIDPFEPFASENLHPNPFCVDTPVELRDPMEEGEAAQFTPGASNQLMIIRACVEVNPNWVGTMIGRIAQRNPQGQYEIHATTVFVHEPA